MPLDSVQVALRLKAARWLAGALDQSGKPAALPVSDLAQRPPLPENRITRNRIEEIEQLKAAPRPMEVEKLAEALGPTAGALLVEGGDVRDEQLVERLPALLAAAQALRRERERTPQDVGVRDRRDPALTLVQLSSSVILPRRLGCLRCRWLPFWD